MRLAFLVGLAHDLVRKSVIKF